MTPQAAREHQATHAHGARLRVVVVDDHPLYRQGVVRTLRKAGVAVVGEGSDGTTALALIRRHLPDVALLDVRMPGIDGIDVVGALARHGPDVPVVLLSAFGDEPLIRAGLQAGAAAYITKDADRELILRAVRAAADPARAPHALAGGTGDLVSTPRHMWIPRLTGNEHQLLTLAQNGMDKIEMCRHTGSDEARVRSALASAIDKLGSDTLPEALEVAEGAGIVRPRATPAGV